MSIQTIYNSDCILDTLTVLKTQIDDQKFDDLCEEHQDECVDQLLAIQSILETQINKRNFNDLCKQIKQGDTLEQCLPLLNKVTDFDQVDVDNKTLLMLAVRYGKEDLQLYLLERTTNIDQVDKYNCEAGEGYNALMFSLENKTTEKVQLALLERTTNVDHSDEYNFSTLMIALIDEATEKVQLALLERATNVDQVTKYNRHNALMISLDYKSSLLVILEIIKKTKVTRRHIDLAINNDYGIIVVDALVNKLINQGY